MGFPEGKIQVNSEPAAAGLIIGEPVKHIVFVQHVGEQVAETEAGFQNIFIQNIELRQTVEDQFHVQVSLCFG